jgi:hypothetical protein
LKEKKENACNYNPGPEDRSLSYRNAGKKLYVSYGEGAPTFLMMTLGGDGEI